MEPHQQIKWAGNGDGSNVRLGVRWTQDMQPRLRPGGAFKSELYGASSTNQMGWES